MRLVFMCVTVTSGGENEMRGGGDGVFIYNNKIIIRRERERESGVWEEDLLCGCLHHYACVVLCSTSVSSHVTKMCRRKDSRNFLIVFLLWMSFKLWVEKVLGLMSLLWMQRKIEGYLC